jgi:hypothetical protein
MVLKSVYVRERRGDDEKDLEAAPMGEERKIRVLYLGYRIARDKTWLLYDSETHQFGVSPQFDIELDLALVSMHWGKETNITPPQQPTRRTGNEVYFTL